MGLEGAGGGGQWAPGGWTEAVLLQVGEREGQRPWAGGEVWGEIPGSDSQVGGLNARAASLRSLCVYWWRSPVHTGFLKD